MTDQIPRIGVRQAPTSPGEKPADQASLAMASDRPNPPATLIIFGFNQEALIDLAIAAAFAQDYDNLQIILSDDGSADSTFALMQAAADAYDGPHRVSVNRTPANRGTLAHVYDVIGKATGELIVMAAGDDVSYPHRVRTLVEAWRTDRPAALFSQYDVIDDGGAVIARDARYDSSKLYIHDYFPDGRLVPIHGASSAYSRYMFDLFEPPVTRILFEDTMFTLGLALLGQRVMFVDETLVQYREHVRSITNATEVGTDRLEMLKRERNAETYAASMLQVLLWFADLAARHPEAGPLDTNAMAADRRFYTLRSRWIDLSTFARLWALPTTRRADDRRWLLARLTGIGGLVLAKRARRLLRPRRPVAAPA